MDSLRKVYHRAVQIPLENVERLWSELETFENSLNKITVRYFSDHLISWLTAVQAKKFMSDLSPSYMQARTVLRQLQRHPGPLTLLAIQMLNYHVSLRSTSSIPGRHLGSSGLEGS
jgi:cleavage stimulation factor subunit 3